MKKLPAAFVLLCLASLAATAVHAGANVLMHHNDNNRTGSNLNETQLTPANVNTTQFGKLWDYEVDAEIYAQPLIVQNVTIPGLGTHNIVIVATMNNTVYAFDADNNLGANVAPLWQTNFNNPAAGIVPPRSGNLYGSITNVDPLSPVGIMSTPAIDLTTNTIYVVARTTQNGNYMDQLHALDLTTGAEKANSPATITASVPGSGYDAVNGVVTFNPQQQGQRSALTIANGKVLIGFGSQADIDPYHGWVMTYDETTLKQTGVFNTSPGGSEAGVWQSGDGPAIDANGNVYYAVGNGTFDGVANFGEDVVKLNIQNGIAVQSFFAPYNFLTLSQNDLDLGVSGPLLIPNTSLLLNGSKTGDLYLLNTGSLGGEVPGNTQIPQTFTAAASHIHGAPVYYPYSTVGPVVYIWSEIDTLKAFHFNGSTLDTTPVTQSSISAPPGMPGGFLSISANGSQAGTGIVWASIPMNASAEYNVVPGVLRAFDASNLATEIWDSQLNPTRDSIGNFAKYAPPTVANGKVYMATFSNKLRVYGLLASQTPAPKGSLSNSKSTATGAVNLTANGTSDWASWPGYVHKAAGGSQISDIEAIYPPYPIQTYTTDQRTFTWTDGTPTASGSVKTGVSATGWAGGFRISAPADTNPRTLTVYVGGTNSSGHLRAYLSDGSAEDVTDTTATNSNSYYNTYTFTYTAGQSGQLLYVEWTQASTTGNVTIAAATLSGGSTSTSPPATPTGATATQGTSTTGVTVTWGIDPGATSYTIYRSTTSGTQGTALTTLTTTSYTDTSAVPGTTYYYSIVAINAYGASTASAQVSGYVPVTAPGVLTGTGLGNLTTVNLTTTGSSDWAHWPEFTEKVTGASQISNYILVGTGPVQTYANAPLTLTWTDGNPAATGSATTGSFVSGIGNGFQIIVPADTNSRQLSIYVGGWSSKGKLTAHLSDGSAADFVDSSYSSTNAIYQANYTLNYHAASAGQTLTVTWTMLSGNGNVVLDGAALAGGVTTPPAAPTGVSATQGTLATGIKVSWGADSGATSYTVYRSSASGSQGSALTSLATTTYTDTSATAGSTYYYSIVATNSFGASPASAQVSGYVMPGAVGVLTGTGLGNLTTVNLTTTGTSDWAHWPEFNEKLSGASQISSYTLVGTAPVQTYANAPLTLTWSDGNVTASGSATTGSFVAGSGNGFQITVPADTTSRQLTVYVGGWSSTGKLTAHLSDGSAADFVDSSYSANNVTYQANYTLTYHATSAGQTLTVTWTMLSGNGNVVLDGAALAGGGGSAPTVPTGLSASQGTSTSGVTVSWSTVNGATGYTVYRSTASGTQGSALTSLTTTSYTDTSAVAGTTYYYSVVATNSFGASAPSAQVSGFVKVSGTAPATPTGVSASQGTSTTGVTVSWGAVTGATSYSVYRSTAPGTQGPVLTSGTTTSYIDTSAVAGTTYYYSVVATNSFGASAPSVQVSGFVMASGTAPATPTGVSASQGTSTTGITVTWGAVTGATSYSVYRSTTSGTQGAVLTSGTTTSYIDTSAVAGNTYYYSIVATNSFGASAPSAQASGYVMASGTAPATPTGLSATQGTSTTGVVLSWGAVTGATGYSVYRSTVSGTQGSVLTTLATTSYTDTSAVFGTTYYYSVVATNSFGASPASAQASGYVMASTPGALTGTGLGNLTTINLTTTGTSDWAHWPEFTEKATGSSQISNYTLVGTAPVQIYGDAPLTLTWSDGNLTASGSATTGSFVEDIGNGFQITVPADTLSRQLTVYVGGWSSKGKLTAHLSDGSAADFVDSSYSANNVTYQANYTLTYHAASAGQTLTVTWTMLSGNGNVVLDGAALAGGSSSAPNAPTSVSATQGTLASGVTVNWSAVSGAISYTLYRSTASGTQGSALTTLGTTSYADTSAVVGTTYYYSVVATNSFGPSPASAQASGYVMPTAPGVLTGAGLGNLTTVNLTTTGTSDWAHWPEFTEKASGSSQISNYTLIGKGPVQTYSNAPLTLTWSDGNLTASGSATTGSFVAGTGNGFQITVPANTNSQQLTVYVGGWSSKGKLTAHLSDGSAADFVDSSYSANNVTYQANYTLTYHAASAGQTLTVTWTMLSGNGNVVLDGATLH